MFRSEHRSAGAPQDGCDLRLRALLREWPTPDPRGGFEAAVWRRIRAAAAEIRPLPGRSHVRCWLALRPAWANALAAAAGIVVGVGLAVAGSGAQAGRLADEPLLHSQTLAGSYLTMVTGGTR